MECSKMLPFPMDEIKDVYAETSLPMANESAVNNITEENKIHKMQRKNWTLKTFLATGLLDGYNVLYSSSIQKHVLHGVIKNGGISCLCGLCKGSIVITPCQFEIHACNKRRCPAQYIRLHNGMSLRQVLIVCQNTSLDVLVNTIHCLLRPQSLKKSTLCVRKRVGKITEKDLGEIVFGEGGLPNGTEVTYFSRGKNLLEGYKIGNGILCLCCNSNISASQFEAHAGWETHKKPYQNIYISNGVSLHEFAISILHKECGFFESIPSGKKCFCNYCQNVFQRKKHVGHNENVVAAGRVDGDDMNYQMTNRCMRIMKTEEEETLYVACFLCRGYDFSKSGFGPRTVIVCDQCEREYHIGCLKTHGKAYLKEWPEGEWFCSVDCARVHSMLQKILSHGEDKVSGSLLDITKKKYVTESPNDFTNFDVRWRILCGKFASSKTKSLLSKIVAIFHDCFDPILDEATGQDFIPLMVYGQNFIGQDFGGMYCALLTINSTIVSVGVLRVLGQEIAELPLVATNNAHQGKGYFKILFSCIEKLLSYLDVKKLVLPAATDAMSMWTEKFNFDKISPDQLSEYRDMCLPMLTFKGTTMLHKSIR